MDLIVQITVAVGALGGWAAALVTYRATRSSWMQENVRLRSEVAELASRAAGLESDLEVARADLKHQLEQARLSVEVEHLLAEEIGSFGGGAPSTALTRARRNAEEALGHRIQRDGRVTTRAAIDGWLTRFDLDPTARDSRANDVPATNVA